MTALNVELTTLEKFDALLREAEEIEMETEMHGDDGELFPVFLTLSIEDDGDIKIDVTAKDPNAKINQDYKIVEDMAGADKWLGYTYGEDLEEIVDAWL